MPLDFSYEAMLALTKIRKPSKISSEGMSPWMEMIYDLVAGAGYSYSRIAYRINVAPSTIQKIATNPKRKPRLKVLHPLTVLHDKVFQGQYVTPRAQEYWESKLNLAKSTNAYK